jgi:hypothetical protein
MLHENPRIYVLYNGSEKTDSKIEKFIKGFTKKWKQTQVIDVKKRMKNSEDRVLPALKDRINDESISRYWSGWYVVFGLGKEKPESGPIIYVTPQDWLSSNHENDGCYVKDWFYCTNLVPKDKVDSGEVVVVTVSIPNFGNESPEKHGKFAAKYLRDTKWVK